jgi:tight adherence protein C
VPTVDALTVVLAAGFALAFLTLLTAVQRIRDRMAADVRLKLVMPVDAFAPSPSPPSRRIAFARPPISKLRQREMREVAEAFGRWRIAPQHARLALTAVEIATALGLAAAVFLVARTLYPSMGALWICAGLALVSGGAGWCAPMLLANEAAAHRAAAVAHGLPDALELLVVCIEGGLSLEGALVRVTQALRPSQPLLAEELALTAADLQMADLGVGLANLANRVNLPDIHSVATTLSQSLRYGTPLADSLRTLAAQIRDETLVKLEERSNRLPTLLTLPMMLQIFPTIFLIVVGPAALHAIDAFRR